MRINRLLAFALIAAMIAVLVPEVQSNAAPRASDPYIRQITSGGTTLFQPGTTGSGDLQSPEFPASMEGDADTGSNGPANAPAPIVNRSNSQGQPGHGNATASAQKAKSNPELVTSFDGLNLRQQRLANGGNQYTVEPPDQGLCVGNGFVMEAVNDVLNVYDSAGNTRLGVVDLNTFYGYIAAINRTTGVRGPFVTDPSCYYDSNVQRWFMVVLTLDTRPNGAYTGPNHLDMAVSKSANPLGEWTIYRIPAQNDGTQGTPNHACDGGPCLGDYPHIGADRYGFYITTNEYPFFGDGFHAAQIYAFSKSALAAGASTINVVLFDTAGAVAGNPGFTVWPATTPGNAYASAGGGTEYFLSSMAAEEANGTGIDNRLALWSLSNTKSLDSANPAPILTNSILTVNPYAIPPQADQKAGDFPLGQCLNLPACSTIVLGAPDPFAPEVETKLDSNDTRMQQVVYANGKLWGALDTAVNVGGADKAGIAWYIINPSASDNGVKGKIDMQGYLAMANNNLTYPAVAVTPSGRGVIAFTLAGADYYPSAAYASIDDKIGAGDVHVAAAGLGPQDGFSGYKAFGNPPRPRWGDYGAAVVDGNSIWIASEYIGQTCTLAQYMAAPFGSCGGTRTSLANWGTRISQLVP